MNKQKVINTLYQAWKTNQYSHIINEKTQEKFMFDYHMESTSFSWNGANFTLYATPYWEIDNEVLPFQVELFDDKKEKWNEEYFLGDIVFIIDDKMTDKEIWDKYFDICERLINSFCIEK